MSDHTRVNRMAKTLRPHGTGATGRDATGTHNVKSFNGFKIILMSSVVPI